MSQLSYSLWCVVIETHNASFWSVVIEWGTVCSTGSHGSLRDAPFDIWGGGLEFLLLANFFFTFERKQSFFLVRQYFLLCFVEEICCRTLSLLCTLPFGVFSGQHIFHQFRQQTFFFCPHFQQTFFSDSCGDKLFFSFFFLPPPPQISNGASLSHSYVRYVCSKPNISPLPQWKCPANIVPILLMLKCLHLFFVI